MSTQDRRDRAELVKEWFFEKANVRLRDDCVVPDEIIGYEQENHLKGQIDEFLDDGDYFDAQEGEEKPGAAALAELTKAARAIAPGAEGDAAFRGAVVVAARQIIHDFLSDATHQVNSDDDVEVSDFDAFDLVDQLFPEEAP